MANFWESTKHCSEIGLPLNSPIWTSNRSLPKFLFQILIFEGLVIFFPNEKKFDYLEEKRDDFLLKMLSNFRCENSNTGGPNTVQNSKIGEMFQTSYGWGKMYSSQTRPQDLKIIHLVSIQFNFAIKKWEFLDTLPWNFNRSIFWSQVDFHGLTLKFGGRIEIRSGNLSEVTKSETRETVFWYSVKFFRKSKIGPGLLESWALIGVESKIWLNFLNLRHKKLLFQYIVKF